MFRKATAIALASLLVLNSTGTAALAQELLSPLRSQSTTQMSSDPQVVYVNTVNDPAERTQDFDKNWKFNFGDVNGAEAENFNDASWENVNLPHDYSIDQEYTKAGEAESAYKLGGIGWYRKSFEVGKSLEGKRVTLAFDGVYNNSTIYVNGHKLGTNAYGYNPFAFDITDYLKFGEQNVVAVRVNHETPSSRWYSGSGITRDVDLVITDAVHVERDGVVVTTPNLEKEQGGNVTTNFKTTIANSGDADAAVEVVQSVLPKKGGDAIGSVTTEKTVAAGATETFEAAAAAANPLLWSTDAPNLYIARTEVKMDGKVVDTYDTTFGYRYFHFDSNTGFSLNGKKVKIEGVCMHQDQGPLGSVSTYDAVERQVDIMQKMGVNAIRTSHNTPTRNLVDICNKKGILLFEEFYDGWTAYKDGNNNDFGKWFDKAMGESEIIDGAADKTWAQFSLEQSVKRDINAPSIIAWSIGNEITQLTTGNTGNYADIQWDLTGWVKALDTTRPVTIGDNANATDGRYQRISEAGGLVGYNYGGNRKFDQAHKSYPNWFLYGSETASAINSRGVYNSMANGKDAGGQMLTSYDTSAVGWGNTAHQAWWDIITRDHALGAFVWTGFDYLGEPTPWNGTGPGAQGTWPSPKSSYFGIVDTAGLPKDSYWLYQSMWNENIHTLHMLPAWNGDKIAKDKDGNATVVVYSDAPAVEIQFTPAVGGETRVVGEKKKFVTKTTPAGFTYQVDENNQNSSTGLYREWKIPYEEGTLTAVAYDEQGNPIDTSDTTQWDGRQSVTTTGAAAKLEAQVTYNAGGLTANGEDLAYITVSVEDKDGNIVPDATNNVKFEVSGAGSYAGVDNGVQPDHQSFRDDNRDAWAGQLVGIVRAGDNAGTIKVKVTSDGLKSDEVEIPVTAMSDGGSAEKTVTSTFYAQHYYVKTGSPLALPETVEVRYSNGTSDSQKVSWGKVSDDQLATPGAFQVTGEVAGVKIVAYVTVLDGIDAMLNYSTATQAGELPVLPAALPGVLADGTILSANFPVNWDMPKADAFATPDDIVVVNGTANVFGVDTPVTASVRVQKETITIGENVASRFKLHLDEASAAKPSDNLQAIVDGSTTIGEHSGEGPNNTCWSNYDYAQAGGTSSSITFEEVTQIRLGKIAIYFGKDGWSASYPKSVKIEVSETGHDGTWNEVAAKATEGEEKNGVKPITYDFAPVMATFVRVTFENSDANLGNRKPCTQVAEVQIFPAQGEFKVGSEATLSKLTVNGQEASASALAAGSFDTPAILADVEAVGTDNAAVTVLPAKAGKVLLIIESEDHAKRGTFTINLGTKPTTDPTDVSRDYPVDQITPTAGSEEANGGSSQGPARLAFDGNKNTMYHSDWDGTSTDNMWVQMELAEPASIEALRYLPRQSDDNGIVKDYKVLSSDDGKTWTEVATGTWDTSSRDWKIAEFDKPVTAKYFRLKAESTIGNGGFNKYMSAAEIRLRTALPSTELTEKSVTIKAPDTYEAYVIDADHPAMFSPNDVKVTLEDGTELKYGVDYVIEYANNTAEGTATLTVKGIYGGKVNYTGEVTHSFTVVKKDPVLSGISVTTLPTKASYTVGEKLDPAGLVLTLAYSDGSSKTVAYGADNADEFTFDVTSFDKAGSQLVTVTYDGFSNGFTVSVADPVDPNPDPEPEPKPDPDPIPDPDPNPNPDGGGNGNGNNNGNDGGNSGDNGNTDDNGNGNTSGSDNGSKPSDDNGSHEGELPQTGDNSMGLIVVLAAGGLVTVGAGVVLRRRKAQ